ncbi:MAG: CotH kinase family protein [Mobilitalea sp.]
MRRKIYQYLLLLIVILSFSGCNKAENKGSIVGEAEVAKEIAEEDLTVTNEISLKAEEITFSQTAYLYKEDVAIRILCAKECEIYYTMDGTNPTKESLLYSNGIELKVQDIMKAYPIRAVAFFKDDTTSNVITHTFFVGKEVENRFTTLVFSVTTDPYNLYDDVYGIFIEGKLRRDYIEANPEDKIEPDDPANYNMRGQESEREVYLEVMEADGTSIASQMAGIRTYGGWSRANLQKSIKIFTRKEYDEKNNKLRYQLFPNKTAACKDGTVIDSFKRLVLRNSGNDNGFAFIRDELFQTLAGQAGYQDYEAVRPAVLFINGTYQGIYWLHENYCDDYFEENYGKYTGNFEILEGGELFKNLEEDGENEKVIEEYDKMYSTYAAADLTEDAVYQKLSEEVDVRNYLSYYALQIYIGNEDWPHNNYKTYRYYTEGDETYGQAPFDGKWRYLLHDLDFSFGIYGTTALVDNIGKYVGRTGEIQEECPLFGQLLRREDCLEIFIEQTLDLINGAFAPENINSVLDEMNASRIEEQKNMYDKNLLEDWVDYSQLEWRLQEIKTYGDQRASHILTKYQEYFNLGNLYDLSVQPADGCEVKVNSYTTKDYFEGSYYTDFNTSISAVAPEGRELDYWMVNGVKTTELEVEITPAMITDKKVEVTCYVK